MYKLPESFKERLYEYMNEPDNPEEVSQYSIDYSKKGRILMDIQQTLLTMIYTSDDLNEWVNRCLSPINYHKIVDYIMKQKLPKDYVMKNKILNFEQITAYKSSLTGEIYESIDELETAENEYTQQTICSHFYESDETLERVIYLKDLKNLIKRFGKDVVVDTLLKIED